MPQKIECNITNSKHYQIENPCGILYRVLNTERNENYKHIIELIEHQQKKTFRCHSFYIITNEMSEFQTKGFNY